MSFERSRLGESARHQFEERQQLPQSLSSGLLASIRGRAGGAKGLSMSLTSFGLQTSRSLLYRLTQGHFSGPSSPDSASLERKNSRRREQRNALCCKALSSNPIENIRVSPLHECWRCSQARLQYLLAKRKSFLETTIRMFW